MAVNYICKHCKTSIGSLDQAQLSDQQLGFHFLTAEEREDIITYNFNGDVIVTILCDYCQEALQNNPELMLVDNPLQ